MHISHFCGIRIALIYITGDENKTQCHYYEYGRESYFSMTTLAHISEFVSQDFSLSTQSSRSKL
jgi:hypothetical protein